MYKNDIKYFDNYGADRLYTPYQETFVPTNGWLIPDTFGTIEKTTYIYSKWQDEYKSVEGGFIHAYVENYKDSSELHNYEGNYRNAYAIKVVAYGKSEDLICRALYIPIADRNTTRRKAIVEFLESNPTVKQIVEKFPFLKGKL